MTSEESNQLFDEFIEMSKNLPPYKMRMGEFLVYLAFILIPFSFLVLSIAAKDYIAAAIGVAVTVGAIVVIKRVFDGKTEEEVHNAVHNFVSDIGPVLYQHEKRSKY